MRIYLTHCSKEKSQLAKETSEKMTPDRLYTNPGLQQFMERCKTMGVNWAILSDRYGIYLPNEHREYYEKHPDTVTPEEELQILHDFEHQLENYDEIWFYVRPETFHPFYERVLRNGKLAERVTLFEQLELIA